MLQKEGWLATGVFIIVMLATVGCDARFQSGRNQLHFDVGDACQLPADDPVFNADYPSGRRPTPDTCDTILIKGMITVGDSIKFAALLESNHPFLDQVRLWSSGGSVDEAMKIGHLVRKAMLSTVAPTFPGGTFPGGLTNSHLDATGKLRDDELCRGESCHCASACFLIWAAGITRFGDALGLHRPSSRSIEFADLSPDRASAAYRKILRDIDAYLTEMEVPRRFIEIVTDTASTDIRWLDFEEANSMEHVPSIVEWIAASCGATPVQNTFTDIFRDATSPRQTCETQKIYNSRDAINQIVDR